MSVTLLHLSTIVWFHHQIVTSFGIPIHPNETSTRQPDTVPVCENGTHSFSWGEHTSRNASTYLQPYENATSSAGGELCRFDQAQTGIVVIVATRPWSFSQRALIRETWASPKLGNARVGFIVGRTCDKSVQKSLEEESATFKDIIQENFVDSYQNLTLKSIAILRWFVHRCPESRFLMKTDDDTFVDVKRLSGSLQSFEGPVLRGYELPKSWAFRDPSNKWYVPKYMYSESIYPPFVAGAAYLMSRDVAVALYKAVWQVPILHLEDVYITGICAKAAGIVPGPLDGVDLIDGSRTKYCRTPMIACNRVTPERIPILWEQLSLTTNSTERPTKSKPN